MQGAILDGATIHGADITEAKLNCVDISGLDLNGVIFESIDLTTEADWNEELHNAQMRLPRIVRADKGPLPGHIFAGSGFVGRLNETFSGDLDVLKGLREAKVRCKEWKMPTVNLIKMDMSGFLSLIHI